MAIDRLKPKGMHQNPAFTQAGNCEPRYAETLKPVTYFRPRKDKSRNYLSYGVKMVPEADACGLNAQQLKMLEVWK